MSSSSGRRYQGRLHLEGDILPGPYRVGRSWRGAMVGWGRLGTDSSRNKGLLGMTSLRCWGTPVGHGGQGDRVGPEAKQ